MKILHNKQPKYNVIGEVNIYIDLYLDSSIYTHSDPDSYPGPKQFLHDVKSMLSDLGYNVLFSENSNRIKSNSPSIYFVYECPLSAEDSVVCTVYLEVSNHRNTDTYFDNSRRDYLESVKQQFYYPTSSIHFYDIFIYVEMERIGHYTETLNDIEQQLEDAEQAFKRNYKNSK